MNNNQNNNSSKHINSQTRTTHVVPKFDDKINFIKLTSLSDNDLYLTKNPEITFFKFVYRRYSNFAIETKNVEFNQNVDLSTFTDIQIPKTGDLISKIYLEIKLPKCYYPKTKKDQTENIENLKNVLLLFQNFFTINNNKVKDFAESIKSESLLFTWLKSINEEYENYNIYDSKTNQFNDLIIQTIDYINNTYNKKYKLLTGFDNANLNLNCFNFQTFLNIYNSDFDKFSLIENRLLVIQQNNKDFYELLNKTLLNFYLQTFENPSYKYAWVENLGYSFIDYVDLYIGDLKVCRDHGQMMYFADILDLTEKQREIKQKLHGNINKLTDFNNQEKEEYSLFIPLNFWFCRNYSTALPLVSLNYEDISLRFKFNEYKNLAYIEKPQLSEYITDNNKEEEEIEKRYGSDLFDNSKINFNLVIDYIYLNKNEREYIAKNSHSFIITQIQKHQEIIENSIYDLKNNNLNIRINDFKHPTKGILWTFQPLSYYKNLDKYTKTEICRYDIDNLSPIKTCSISINSNLYVKQNNEYFEYLQPYEHYKNSGVKGLYSFWFSLNPDNLQPSGNCNFTKIKELLLNLDFNSEIFKNRENENFIFNCYAINYNILIIENGFIRLVYN